MPKPRLFGHTVRHHRVRTIDPDTGKIKVIAIGMSPEARARRIQAHADQRKKKGGTRRRRRSHRRS